MRNLILIALTVLQVFCSLTSIAEINYEDSVKLAQLRKTAYKLYTTNLDSAILLCNEGFEIASPDSNLIIGPLTTKALIYFQAGKKEKSLVIMDQIIDITIKTKNNKRLASAYRNKGQIEQYTGEHKKAIDNYMLAQKVYRRYGEYEGHPMFYSDIGDLFYVLNDFSKSKQNYNKGLKVAVIQQNQELITEFEVRLAKIYVEEENLDSAEYLAIKADKFYVSIGKTKIANDPKNILADIYVKKNDLEKAINIFQFRKKALKSQNNDRSYALVCQKAGQIYLKQNKYDKALVEFNLSYPIHKKLKSPSIADDMNMLAFIYEQKGNYNKAFKYSKEHHLKYKEIQSAEKIKDINDIQIKYETEKTNSQNTKLAANLAIEKKENELSNAKLKTRNYIVLGVIIVFLALLVIGLLFYNKRKITNSNKMLRLEQRLLKTQMNPHFMFNSLMSAQGYIYDNKPKEASAYLTKFARLMRLVLENSRKDFILLEDEVLVLKNYLVLQQERNNSFDFDIYVDSEIDIEEVELPPMLIQPFIENTVEHGFKGIKERGLIKVSFKANQNKLEVSILDNGVGRKQTIKKIASEHKSLASTIVKERVSNLAKYYRQKLEFKIIDNINVNNEANGTEVILSLPLKS